MMRGRKPLPTHLKLLRGNPGHQRLPQNEPKPALLERVPAPPEFLQGYACEEWYRVAQELWALGILSVVDVNPLAAYCVAYARWRTAEEALAKMAKGDPVLSGLMVKSSSGAPMQNPIVLTSAKAANDMVRFATEFGLTPAARSRIDAGPDGGGRGPRKFDGYLGGR